MRVERVWNGEAVCLQGEREKEEEMLIRTAATGAGGWHLPQTNQCRTPADDHDIKGATRNEFMSASFQG